MTDENKPVDNEAPYGRKKDGTPAKKRGRKPKQEAVTQ